MQALDGRGDLEEVQLSLGLVKLHLLDDIVEQLHVPHQLQQDEEEIGHVDHILLVFIA